MSPQDKHTIIASATAASPPTRRRLIGTPKIDSASNDRIDYCSDCLAYALGAVSLELIASSQDAGALRGGCLERRSGLFEKGSARLRLCWMHEDVRACIPQVLAAMSVGAGIYRSRRRPRALHLWLWRLAFSCPPFVPGFVSMLPSGRQPEPASWVFRRPPLPRLP